MAAGSEAEGPGSGPAATGGETPGSAAPARRSRTPLLVAAAVAAVALGAMAWVLQQAMVARRFIVPQSAMAPAIYAGQQIRVDATAYGWHLPIFGRLSQGVVPARGDIVVFDWPSDRRYIFVMRVVAVAGDSVQVSSRGVSLGGQALPSCDLGTWPAGLDPRGELDGWSAMVERNGEAAYVVLRAPDEAQRQGSGSHCVEQPCSVPAGHVFVLGDSRDASLDSRDWGLVPLDHLIGRAERVERGDAPEGTPEHVLSEPHVPDALKIRLEACRASAGSTGR